MTFAAERDAKPSSTHQRGTRIFTGILAVALIVVAANCFLKYLWWAACYSAWYGIPKLADQWRAAGSRASFYCWSLAGLELASVALLFHALRLPSSDGSGFLRHAPRLILSFALAIAATGALVLFLSWVKQGVH
ncbi:MAG TPA: hypothetical protein VMB19_08345 [Silvibacterium sp.]|nr:hypothetical protein [Silvibacterium sp.]